MAVFYQQSGARGEADFKRTLFVESGEPRLFTAAEVADKFGYELPVSEWVPRVPASGFQIWGVPSGAKRVLASLSAGDLMLLIGRLSRTELDFARFSYAGRVVHVAEGQQFELSRRLWGEGGFPLIFFMQGKAVDYSWREFTADFAISPGYYLAGQTMRLKQERLAASRYQDTDGLAERLGVSDRSLLQTHPNLPAQRSYLEGGKSLVLHERLERDPSLVRDFKAALTSFACVVCDFDFHQAYGDIGTQYIEAHHSTPLAEGGKRNSQLHDLVPVCANCHRMLHRRWPAVDVATLQQLVAQRRQAAATMKA